MKIVNLYMMNIIKITNNRIEILPLISVVIVPPATTAAWPILVIEFQASGVSPKSWSDKKNGNIYTYIPNINKETSCNNIS